MVQVSHILCKFKYVPINLDRVSAEDNTEISVI